MLIPILPVDFSSTDTEWQWFSSRAATTFAARGDIARLAAMTFEHVELQQAQAEANNPEGMLGH